MPVIHTENPYISETIKSVMSFEDDSKVNFNYETVTVGGTATELPSFVVPVIWVDGNARFEVYVDQDIDAAITTGGSPLPDGSVIALMVGTASGYGFYDMVDLTAGNVSMKVLYRGDAAIVAEKVTWGSATTVAQDAFVAQLEKQRITTVDNAEVITPSFEA